MAKLLPKRKLHGQPSEMGLLLESQSAIFPISSADVSVSSNLLMNFDGTKRVIETLTYISFPLYNRKRFDGSKVGSNANTPRSYSRSTPKRVPKTSDGTEDNQLRLVTVKELSRRYGVSIGNIYTLIRTDPSFPYVNLGVKKKLLVDINQYEIWVSKRTTNQKSENFEIPTTEDLLALYKRNDG